MLGLDCARSPEAQTARHLDRGDSYLKKARYREAIIEYENALRIQRTDPRATRQLGLAHYQLGEFGQAARYLLKAEELAPDQLDVRLKLGALYILDRRWKEAQAEADYVLARDPRNLEALLLVADAAATAEEVESAVQRLEATRTALGDPPRLRVALANLHVRKQDVTGAESLLQGAVQEDPKSIEAHAALAELDLLKGDHASAEREFQAAAALAPLASPARIRLAHYFVLARRSADARRVLGEVTAKAPRYLPAWRLLAEIALAEGRLDDADKALKPVFKRNPQDLDGHLLKGRVFLARKSSELAILEFQQVLKLEPRLAAAHYQLALAHLQGGNVQQAKAELKETITISPDHVEARLRLAQLNLEAGAVDPAIEDMTRLVAAQPRLLEGYVLLGAAHLQKNEPGKALEIYRKLAAVAPKDPRSPYLVGIGLLAEGKLAEARKSLETALALAPGYIDALAQLVRLDLLDKKPEAAVGRVRQQIEAAGDSGGPQELLGGVLETQQKSELAEAAYLRAIELEPGLMGAYLGLAQLYTRAGRLDLALLKADEALKANPATSRSSC